MRIIPIFLTSLLFITACTSDVEKTSSSENTVNAALHLYDKFSDISEESTLEEFKRNIALEKEITTKAKAGDIEAQITLGELYRRGKKSGITQDHNKAAEWYQKAANQGNNYAHNMADLTYILKLAEGQPDFNRIKKNADNGDPEALFILGMAHATGKLTGKQDFDQWATLLKAAAKKGHLDAQIQLAETVLSADGEKYIKKDIAIDYMKSACQEGYQRACMIYQHLIGAK